MSRQALPHARHLVPLAPKSLLVEALVGLLALAMFACTGEEGLPTQPSFAKGGNAASLTVTPEALTLALVPGTPATLTAKVQFVGPITAATSDAGCATVSPGSVPATKPPGSSVYLATFSVTPVAAGSCRITVTDKKGDHAETQVVVTTVELRAQTLTYGEQFTCGLTQAGAAYCWGSNQYGQLGTTTNSGTTTANPTPTAVSGGHTFVALTAGRWHACGLTAAGAAYCWGANDGGQLGSTTNSGTGSANPTPRPVSGGLTFAGLSAGGSHTCGVTGAGLAYCWGGNFAGALGTTTNNGTSTPNPAPAAVSGGLKFVALRAGEFHTCALTGGGTAYCWGENLYGQLGTTTNNGTVNPNPTPAAVAGGPTFVALTAGRWHACGLTSAGAAYCWGDNAYGELGTTTNNGAVTANPITAVGGGLTFVTIGAGAAHTCGLTGEGVAYCWGNNLRGQLGTTTNNGTVDPNPTPAAVGGGLTFVAIGAGAVHTCGLTGAGAAYCWGENDLGQLGSATNSGTTAANPAPAAVSGGIAFAVP